ncbi:MAG: protein-disulfide reductase DsbD domain-containing protein [Verrucomicrobiota bacterium]
MRSSFLLSVLLLSPLLETASGANPLDVELLSEQRSIHAGEAFCLGLHLRHPEGHHSYWKHPGIVGLATQVEWELPPGIVAADVQWPAPEVVKMAAYDTQGYQGETLLLIPMTAAANLITKTVTLTAKVSWMCCGTTCNPALKVPFVVTLPVGDSAEPDPATQALFAKFRASVPKPDPAWGLAVKHEQGSIILTLQSPTGNPLPKTAEGIRFFTADGQVDSSQKQSVEVLSDGRIKMSLTVSEFAPPHPTTLPGVVSLPAAWQVGGRGQMEINPAY